MHIQSIELFRCKAMIWISARPLMIVTLLILGTAVISPITCHAQELCATKDGADRRIERLEDLPLEIPAFLRGQSEGLAGKGEPYNETDAINVKWPCRRFKNAAVGSERAVVRMEVGCNIAGPTLQWFWFKKSGDSWEFTGDNP